MKHLLTLLTFLGIIALSPANEVANEEIITHNTEFVAEAEPTRSDSLNALMSAMKYVESRGDSLAYNKRERAAGVLQIRPIMLREINRQLRRAGHTYQYTREDRFSEVMSEKMFLDYVRLLHYDHSIERIARCWNGGPRGNKKKATSAYWAKVQSKLIY